MGNALKSHRERVGLSQGRLAILTGFLTQGEVSDFERGRRWPWPKARRALAECLGVPEEELFEEVGLEDDR